MVFFYKKNKCRQEKFVQLPVNSWHTWEYLDIIINNDLIWHHVKVHSCLFVKSKLWRHWYSFEYFCMNFAVKKKKKKKNQLLVVLHRQNKRPENKKTYPTSMLKKINGKKYTPLARYLSQWKKRKEKSAVNLRCTDNRVCFLYADWKIPWFSFVIGRNSRLKTWGANVSDSQRRWEGDKRKKRRPETKKLKIKTIKAK